MIEILQIEPARAKSNKAGAYVGDPVWIAEPKLDGWRYLLHLDRDLERPHLTGRRTSKETGLFSEKGLQIPQIQAMSIDVGYTVVDGEIMPPDGAGFRDIAGIMNADLPTAHARIREIGCPTYNVFDILFLDGEDLRQLSWAERQERLKQFMLLVVAHPMICRIGRVPNSQESYDSIVAQGGEGLILKDITAPYGEGWKKLKKFSSLDVIVTGFTDARFGRTGKYVGQIGAVCVSVYSSKGELLEVGQVSGMPDDVRKEISENQGEWLGRVIEIAAQEWGKDRLRHPRWKRTRDDADARSCTFAKMMRDLGGSDDREDENAPGQNSAQGSLF